MYRIKLKKTSKNEFDKIIEIEEEGKAKRTYWGYMKEDYFFGSYNRVINGKEQNIASFCKSEFA
jgi:hypothetical protein